MPTEAEEQADVDFQNWLAWVLGRKLLEELGHQRPPHSGDEERLRCEKLLERPHRE
jgi:hypothetical protein